jgi:hypothetical protein
MMLSRSVLTPLGGIVSGARKRLFLAAYQASDRRYWEHRESRSDWHRVGAAVEYDSQLIAVRADAGSPVCLMNLRTVTGLELRCVKLKVVAKTAGVIYQDTIVIERLGHMPVTKALTGIPLPVDADRIRASRLGGEIYIKVVSAVGHDGSDLVAGKKMADRFRPTLRECPNDEYVECCDQYWNIDEIHHEKQNLRHQWFKKILQPAGQLWRPLTVRRIVFWAFTNACALELGFWSKNLFNAKQIRSSPTVLRAPEIRSAS